MEGTIMKVGIIGLGLVGGTLKKWFDNHTNHQIKVKDLAHKLDDDFLGIDACFICIDVPPSELGQDQNNLEKCVNLAKQYTQNVFIRSTVLPGTNDKLGTIALPEFLTARRAYEDMCKLPIVVGKNWLVMGQIFPGKQIIMMANKEAELAKYAHNCHGAIKVTWFNIIRNLADHFAVDYEQVRRGALLTGFVGEEHTKVPGPDGFFGYGGSCFPNNIESFKEYLLIKGLEGEAMFLRDVALLNEKYRLKEIADYPEVCA
jgi:UDP-glucose 6-dehydrogenase